MFAIIICTASVHAVPGKAEGGFEVSLKKDHGQVEKAITHFPHTNLLLHLISKCCSCLPRFCYCPCSAPAALVGLLLFMFLSFLVLSPAAAVAAADPALTFLLHRTLGFRVRF